MHRVERLARASAPAPADERPRPRLTAVTRHIPRVRPVACAPGLPGRTASQFGHTRPQRARVDHLSALLTSGAAGSKLEIRVVARGKSDRSALGLVSSRVRWFRRRVGAPLAHRGERVARRGEEPILSDALIAERDRSAQTQRSPGASLLATARPRRDLDGLIQSTSLSSDVINHVPEVGRARRERPTRRQSLRSASRTAANVM